MLRLHEKREDRKLNEPRKYPMSDVKLLWGLSAARCAFPGCRDECVEEATNKDGPVVLGKIAHIVAHSREKGPRSDPLFPAEQLDRYENWILLCGRDHDIVDGQPNTYTVEDLRRWKTEHELWVRQRLSVEIPGVTFAELEVVTKGLLAANFQDDYSFALTNPREKMNRNGLTEKIDFLVKIGFSKVREVAEFVNFAGQMYPDFAEHLKSGFVKKYSEFKEQGVEGDALFEALHQFASGSSHDFRRQAAGLAVLMYLFEICEVFER